MESFFKEFGHIVTMVGMVCVTAIAVAALYNGIEEGIVTTCLVAIVALALGRWPFGGASGGSNTQEP